MEVHVSSLRFRRRWDAAHRVAFLRTVPSFGTLPETALCHAAGASHVRCVDRNEFIFLAGQAVDGLTILAEGQVKVVRETDGDHNVGSGWYISGCQCLDWLTPRLLDDVGGVGDELAVHVGEPEKIHKVRRFVAEIRAPEQKMAFASG